MGTVVRHNGAHCKHITVKNMPMNNRDYKIFAPNTFHHVYNRGNGKMDIFKDAQDFANFYKRLNMVLGLQQWASLYSTKMPIVGTQLRISPFPEKTFSILSHCLMPNHFHFLIRQNSEIPISNLISKLCNSYAKYFNNKYGHVGGLFQDQFKSIMVDSDQYLLWLSAYIHANPITAGLVKSLNNYVYSSYPDYCGLRDGKITSKDLILGMFNNNPKKYEAFVLQNLDKIKQQKDLSCLLLD